MSIRNKADSIDDNEDGISFQFIKGSVTCVVTFPRTGPETVPLSILTGAQRTALLAIGQVLATEAARLKGYT